MPWGLDETLIVIPAYNEARCVGNVLREIQVSLPGVDVLVVDDGSTDNTADEAEKTGAIVASLPFNLGVGGAMRLGFLYALKNGYPVVVQVDADGQHDPANVPALLKELEHSDVVLGSRFAGTGDYKIRGPRRWAMRILAATLSRTAHTTLTDTTSGFRASGPKAVSLFSRHYPAEYLGDTVESLVIAARAGLVIRQVPVAMRARAAGVSSHRPFKAAVYLGRAAIALAVAFIHPPSTYRMSVSK